MIDTYGLNLYLVKNGEADEADSSASWDGIQSILVLASSASEALIIASAYDAGALSYDNIQWGGKTIACCVQV